MSALTLTALIHLLSTTTRQRVERARENVTEEVTRLARGPRRLVEEPANGVVGMRGGAFDGSMNAIGIPEKWRASVESAVRAARGAGKMTAQAAPLGDATLVVAAMPSAGDTVAWAGFLVRPLPSLRTWQWIVTLLSLATAGLVATTLYSVVTVQRGASALRSALGALETDLNAPIPRPGVRELSSVADGVAKLASALARARREEERLHQKLAQQERLAALGRVAAGVAHEVRNPLASIKLRLDLAAAESALPPDVQKAISHATTEIGRLDRLVADLLIVAGRAAGPRRRTSLAALARARVEALSPWASGRDVALECRGDVEVDVEVDPDAIARAMDNLLRNGVEASPKGAKVAIAVTGGNGSATVSVTDLGPGVAPEHSLELFEPFFTTKPDGTGLGLALSRAIARAHGGELQYHRDGNVTRLDLILPLSSEASQAPGSSMSRSSTGALRGIFA